MKVQRKGQPGVGIREVLDEAMHFYIVSDPYLKMPLAASKQDYEPVEEWVVAHIYVGKYRAIKDGDMITVERKVQP